MDNLGATVDWQILGWMQQNNIDFVMEVTDKTRSDIKGGTLCVRNTMVAITDTTRNTMAMPSCLKLLSVLLINLMNSNPSRNSRSSTPTISG